MTVEIKLDELAALVRAKRGTRGLRTVAQEIGGISASTLSRIERGEVPDLETFARLCCWLGVSAEEFIPSTEVAKSAESRREYDTLARVPGMGTPEIIAAHLRADRTLEPA